MNSILEAFLAHARQTPNKRCVVFESKPLTYADLRKSEALLGYRPQVDITTGIQRFATWFRAYSQN